MSFNMTKVWATLYLISLIEQPVWIVKPMNVTGLDAATCLQFCVSVNHEASQSGATQSSAQPVALQEEEAFVASLEM